MRYIVITRVNLVWFILSLITNMFIATAIVTPKWLIASSVDHSSIIELNLTKYRNPSVGIYTRCKYMRRIGYNCGPFDLDGFATTSNIYPGEWKAAMFFISLGYAVQAATIVAIVVTCCKQSILGKSLHNVTGCLQIICGILIILATFLHLLGWGAQRVKKMCGDDSEAFSPGDCTPGWSLLCAIVAASLCFLCAGISPKAKPTSNAKRRIEEGECLVCVA